MKVWGEIKTMGSRDHSTEQHTIDLDAVMKIPSRKQMDKGLPIHKQALQNNRPFSILMIDFDDLKKLNNKVGHPDADKVLCSVAQCIREHLAGKGEVYRYAGDELLVILDNFELAEAHAVAERLRRNVETLSHEPLEVTSTVTIGVAAYPIPITEPDKVVIAADKALLAAKSDGKNRISGGR